MLKKVILSTILLFSIFSCTSDGSTSNNTGGGTIDEPGVAMTTRVDGVIYDTPPQNGGNAADASGGIYGNTYFLLNGYKNTATVKLLVGNKIFQIKVAIPKNDITVGMHNFSSAITAGGYYADFDITGVSPPENVITNSGFIKITSYDTTTGLLKGNFSFTTNDGINLTTNTHELIGSFSYILQ